MKKLLKALGITIALTAIGVGVRAISKKFSDLQSQLNKKPGLIAIDFIHKRIDDVESTVSKVN